MSRKGFQITVDFDVHAVTCPGVWLCPKGAVILRVAMFGLMENSKCLQPCFPLLFHQRFRFKKLLKSVSNLSCLQDILKSRNLHMQLVHLAKGPNCCPATILATFKSSLADVFFPTPSDRGLNVGVDTDLLLKPSSAFPGIISPKVEISTRVVIEETINFVSPNEDLRIVNPVTVSSKKLNGEELDDVIGNRQRPVCHTDAAGGSQTTENHVCCCYNNKKVCDNGKQNADKQKKPPFLTGKLKASDKRGSTHEKQNKLNCYKGKKLARPKGRSRDIEMLEESELNIYFFKLDRC